ncbi:MAG: ABC transporter permease, partial [Porphyromonadaceae bacterium]|nr:ABC transporter permease [Porphyromonadaceae bacterium]
LGTIGMSIIDRIISSYAWASKTINGMTITLFYDPMITFRTAVAIVIVMIICGAISGYLPARKTLKISAVDAMRK